MPGFPIDVTIILILVYIYWTKLVKVLEYELLANNSYLGNIQNLYHKCTSPYREYTYIYDKVHTYILLNFFYILGEFFGIL